MSAAPPTVPAPLIRYQRRSMALGGLLAGACFVIDLVQPNTAATLAIRAAWVLALLAGAWLQRPKQPVAAALAAQGAGLLTGLAVLAIVALTGGTRSIFSGMLLATPFAVLVAAPAFPSSAALTGVSLLLGGVYLRVAEGQRPADVASWAVLSSAMVILATYGTVASRRLWWKELETERGRTRALEALAQSERRRAEAERLAEVGRLAAGAAHSINSPLSAVRANVTWLGEGRAQDASERDEVLDDTLEAVDKISGILTDLNRAALPPGAPRPPLAPPAAPRRHRG